MRETFWAQLMVALHRSNRQAEALAVYQEVRDHLADELGVDPGPRLRQAHEQVLGGEVPALQVPRQLPAGVPHFVGREPELNAWQQRYEDMLEALLAVHPRSLNHDVAYDVASHLGTLGRAYFRTGDVGRALEHCGRAAELFAGLDDLPDIDASNNQEILGEIHLQLGQPEEAVRRYSESVRLHKMTGNVTR